VDDTKEQTDEKIRVLFFIKQVDGIFDFA